MMQDVLVDLADQQAELAALLEGLDDDGWARPTPCEGWDIADVVLHLAQTDEMAVGAATGRFDETLAALTHGIAPAADVDEGAARMVERDRATGPGAAKARWDAGRAALLDALRACPAGTKVRWVVGELSARTLATTRLAETWIHTGDVAAAVGVRLAPTNRLRHIARLAWRTLPYAFTRAGRTMSGPVAFELTGPGGDRWAFEPEDGPAITVVRGDAEELCRVAARRVDPSATRLRAAGPDADAVLALVRTYA